MIHIVFFILKTKEINDKILMNKLIITEKK